jgi:hypothetical protein
MVRSKLHRNRMSAVGKAKSTEKEKLKPHPPNHRTPEHNLALCSLGKHEPTPTQEKPNSEISIQPSRILHFFHNTEKEAGHFDMTQVQADFTFPSYKLSFPSPSSGGLVPVLERGDGKELEDKVQNNERMLVSLSFGSRVAEDLVAETGMKNAEAQDDASSTSCQEVQETSTTWTRETHLCLLLPRNPHRDKIIYNRDITFRDITQRHHLQQRQRPGYQDTRRRLLNLRQRYKLEARVKEVCRQMADQRRAYEETMS